MGRSNQEFSLSALARAGFQQLALAHELLTAVHANTQLLPEELLRACSAAADPDSVVQRLTQFTEQHPRALRDYSAADMTALFTLWGASPAFADFFLRHPERLAGVLRQGGRIVTAAEARTVLEEAVTDPQSGDTLTGVDGWCALRVSYRELLAHVMLYDLGAASTPGGSIEVFETVSRALSDLAAAAVAASYQVALAQLRSGVNGAVVSREQLAALRFSVIAMGKCGAEELNVVSDVDVMFLAETRDAGLLSTEAMLRIATRLASETMRGIHDPAIEPPLWQLDANLRPEGRHGALVRTLDSMVSYYAKWAKAWEFQALLKARPLAGDTELGAEFVQRTRAAVWDSSSREDFVGSVQRMRERVTENIASEDVEHQLKLGPGGLRDIEFSAQLLQLVHGKHDASLHVRGTIPALRALVAGGYIARSDGERLVADYSWLRVCEHRLQLRELRRTALMPRDDDQLRVLARSSGLAASAEALHTLWLEIQREVRELHVKIFYAPLLSAVAALPGEEMVLGSEEATQRLRSIGFADPAGAMRHLTALTRGTSRRAQIQRNLMPVLLQWLSEGTDPDYGLLAFRRVSEANEDTPWYLRLLRDGNDAAERLMHVLSCSHFAAELLETVPEAVAWLERDSLLLPQSFESLHEEMRALTLRRDTAESAAAALRTVHRREVLRLACGRLTGVLDDAQVSVGLDAAHTALLQSLLFALRREYSVMFSGASEQLPEIAVIGMGSFGGRALGFASDLDVIAVYRSADGAEDASALAGKMVTELRRLVSDPRFPVNLDFDLRPEGKNGPLVRSLEAYQSYYGRWSVTWEAQALLRARWVAGDSELGAAFLRVIDPIRYPKEFPVAHIREVRRIKARVEAERLANGADPKRHLKLGPGGISDVEWLLQLLQLQHAYSHAELRSSHTLTVLEAAQKLRLVGDAHAETLREAWTVASETRSALKLWTGRTSDVLPVDWNDLEGLAGILGVSRGATSQIEERWFAVARRARRVFESEFFGYDEQTIYPTTQS